MSAFPRILGAVSKGLTGLSIDREQQAAALVRERQESRAAEALKIASAAEMRQTSRDAALNAFTKKQTDLLGAPKPPSLTTALETGPDGKPRHVRALDAPGVVVDGPTVHDEVPTGTVLAGADGKPPQLVVTRPGGGHKIGETIAVPDVSKQAGGNGMGGGALKTAIAENRAQIKAIDNAIELLEKNPDATGLKRGIGAIPGMGKIGELANQTFDSEGNPTRDALGRISSVVIKDVSGANVTGPEWSRLGWVPDAAYDSKRNLEKLRAMRSFADSKTQEMERAAGVTHAAGAGEAGGGMTHEQQLWDAAVTKHGREKVLQAYGPRP